MLDILNIEIKAYCNKPKNIHDVLKELSANYKGCDHQIDTYFNYENGRLKIRKGNIENSLIFYKRSNQKNPKESKIVLTKLPSKTNLKKVLKIAYGIKIEVEKKRHIYFIDNVKFHIDEVNDLGNFVEIEAIDNNENIGIETLNQQCKHYMKVLKIKKADLINYSYSDLLLEK